MNWFCEVHESEQVNGNPHMHIETADTAEEALVSYCDYMRETHSYLGPVLLVCRTGKPNPPTRRLEPDPQHLERRATLVFACEPNDKLSDGSANNQ